MRTLVATAALLVLIACAPEPPEGASASDRPSAESAPPAAPGPAPARQEPDSAFVALEGGGLRVFLASTGSARPLPFGTASADATRVLSAALGGAPVEQGVVVDCAAEYARWDDGLTVWFADGRFAGWSLDRGSALTTADGLGLGTTRSALEAAREITVTRSSLGAEFTVGELAGLLESDAADARIQHLWSGHTCIAR